MEERCVLVSQETGGGQGRQWLWGVPKGAQVPGEQLPETISALLVFGWHGDRRGYH